MAITFPTNPANGDKYSGYIYNSTDNAWSKVTAGDVSSTVNYGTVNDLPLTGNNPGDQVYVTGNNRLYIWNGDGWYNIALINTAPQITQGGAGAYTLADDGTPTVITLVATDPEELPITWSYSVTSGSLGNTATVSQADNVFTITPSTNSADAGTFSITFTASDGVNLSTDVNSFELAFFVEDSKYTSALITSIGGNGDVNTGLTDKNTTPKTLTVSGATAQTFSPYRSGGYSYYFDGSGDYLSIPNDTSLQFGTGDFTIESWIYFTSINSSTYQTVFGSWGGANAFNFIIQIKSDTFLFSTGNNSAFGTQYTASETFTTGQWYHIAVSREGTNLKFFLNGTQIGTTQTDSSNMNSTAPSLYVGMNQDGSIQLFNGYISDARIVNGTALYTSAFTSPTERLTAVTNTSLLTCQLPYPKDSSSNDHTITVNGNVSAKPFAPYDYKEYDSATHGASLYTASGQYITVADTNDLDMGTGDFTVEFWHYNVSTPGNYPSIVSGESWSNPSGGVALRFNNTTAPNKVAFFWNGIGDPWLTSSSSFRANEWMHIALTRSGNNFTLWVNGKQEATGSNAGSIDWCKGGDFHIHWGAWDGSNGYVNGFTTDLRILKGTALYTAAFTPPTEPLEEITNTVLLVNGHDDAAIIDKAQSGGLVLNGNTQSSTAVTNNGSSSMYLDGTGDYITLPHTPEYDLNTGDFTIEAWVYQTVDGVTAANETYSPIISLGNFFSANSSSRVSWDFRYNQQQGNKLKLSHKPTNNFDSTFKSSHSNAINMGTGGWHHVAVTRESGTINFWYDGTNVGSDASTFNGVNLDVSIPANDNLYLGRMSGGTSLDQYTWHFTGYIEDARVTKGLARYTANFTPPSASLKG